MKLAEMPSQTSAFFWVNLQDIAHSMTNRTFLTSDFRSCAVHHWLALGPSPYLLIPAPGRCLLPVDILGSLKYETHSYHWAEAARCGPGPAARCPESS